MKGKEILNLIIFKKASPIGGGLEGALC